MACDGMELIIVSITCYQEDMAYFVCSIADGHDALVIPLLENIFLQWYQDRRDLPFQDVLEFQSGSDVVVFSLLEQPSLVFLGVNRNVVTIGSLRQLEEIKPIYATSRAAIDDIRFMFPEHRVGRARLNALTRIGDSENASIVTRDGWKRSVQAA